MRTCKRATLRVLKGLGTDLQLQLSPSRSEINRELAKHSKVAAKTNSIKSIDVWVLSKPRIKSNRYVFAPSKNRCYKKVSKRKSLKSLWRRRILRSRVCKQVSWRWPGMSPLLLKAKRESSISQTKLPVSIESLNSKQVSNRATTGAAVSTMPETITPPRNICKA